MSAQAMAGEAGEQQKSGGPGQMIVFTLAGLALLGVGGVVAFGLLGPNASNDGAPQVIAAAEGEDKVEPETAEDTASRPGDAVFETLSDDARASVDEPRVVLPGPGSDSSVRSITPTADIAPAPPGSTASRPVRTVTVRADGTVVETAPTQQAPAVDTDVTVEAAEARPVQVVEVAPDILTPGTVSGDPISNATETIAAAAQSTLQASTQAVVDQVVVPNITPPQPVARPAIAPVQPAQTQPAQTQPVQTAQAQSQPAQTQPSAAQSTQPIALAAPSAAPATVTPPPAAPAPQQVATAPATPTATQPAPTGDFVVQLASLRSPEQAQATFNTLQGRFGSILTGFTPDIQRADLGERGIYHRLRVGPMDRASANSLCQRYQAAGGDCIVQRR
jgi:cell division septation protein DedD